MSLAVAGMCRDHPRPDFEKLDAITTKEWDAAEVRPSEALFAGRRSNPAEPDVAFERRRELSRSGLRSSRGVVGQLAGKSIQ